MQKVLNMKISSVVSIIILALTGYIFCSYGVIEKMRSGNVSDQYYYKLYYEGGISESYFEPGYKLLTIAFLKMGFSYQMFKISLWLISLFLIWSFIRRIKVNYTLILLLYALSVFSADLEQSRFYFAMSLVICSFNYLFNTNKVTNSKIKFFICIIVASSIHIGTAIFFVLAVLFKKQIKLDYCFLIFGGIASIGVLFPILKKWVGLIIYSLTGDERITMWFSYHTGLGFLACVFLHGIMLYALWLQKRQLSDSESEEYDMVCFAYKVLQLLSLVFLFYLASSEFIRAYRGLFVFFYCVILYGANKINIKTGDRRYKIKYTCFLFCFVTGYSIIFPIYKVVLSYYGITL